MTTAEIKARQIINESTTARLLDLWETTIENNDANIYTVRGWIMDELKSRNPQAFNKWLDSDCDDYKLRDYYNI